MLKKVFRWFVRLLVTASVLFLIAFVSDQITHRVSSGSILVVTLKGPVVERGTPGLLGVLTSRETPLDVLRTAVSRAARDPRISGLALEVIDPEMELSQAEEISALVEKFRKSGKWTAAYLETAGEMAPGNLAYLVAASAGEVSLMPLGELNLVGVAVREMFARETLDWLGVHPAFGAIGEYKTAANVFTEKDFTPAQREEDDAMVGSMFDQIVEAVASERHLSADQVRAIIDQAPFVAEGALKAHLVDRLEYRDEFVKRAKHVRGVRHELVAYSDYARPSMFAGFGARDRIAVVYCDGEIVRGESRGFGLSPSGAVAGSDDLVDAFRRAREDSSVRAIILRVNSPGGSVIGSELIRHAAELAANEKPMVVSMSGYAASGGYWVSTPAREMIAEPGTITGSIGVLGGKFNIAPMAQKIYLNSGAITRGANVEMFDAFTDFTPAQEKMFQEQLLGDTYNRFTALVARSRHMTVEDVDRIARGRVWTGAQAEKIKLVDSLGGFDLALAEAKKLARIPPEREVPLEELPVQPGLIPRLLSGQISARAARVPAALQRLAPAALAVKAALERGGLVGALYCPVVPIR